MVSLKRFIRDSGGFTLVELMFIVAILTILAAIAIPQFRGVTEDADRQAARGDLSRAWSAAKANVVGVSDMQSVGSYIEDEDVRVDSGKTSINQLVIFKNFPGGVCEMTIPNNGQNPSFGGDC